MVEFECTFNLDIPFHMYDLYGKCNDLNFTPFNYTEHKNVYDTDIDPDNSFYNNLCINSQYFTEFFRVQDEFSGTLVVACQQILIKLRSI